MLALINTTVFRTNNLRALGASVVFSLLQHNRLLRLEDLPLVVAPDVHDQETGTCYVGARLTLSMDAPSHNANRTIDGSAQFFDHQLDVLTGGMKEF